MARRSLADLGRGRRRLTTLIRLVLFTCLILALSGVQLVRPSNSLCTIFVVDVSDSIDPAERTKVLDYIHQAMQKMKARDSVALVAFGAEALLDHAPEDDQREIAKIVSLPGATRTNIAAGIQLAMASFPQETGKHVVVFTDGNENEGNSLDQADLAVNSDVRISVVPLQRDMQRGEALLLSAVAPAAAHQGSPFQVSVIAQSLQPTEAAITLLRDRIPVETRNVSLKAGKTAISFEQSIADAGVHHYRAVLDIPGSRDAVADNNVADTYIDVQGKPSVLIVENTPGDGSHLARALQANDLQVEMAGPNRIPQNLAQCTQYDSIIFANVPAYRMAPVQMELIRSAVHDTGMGFAMVGGEDSFGAGGYLKTPIEEALPVEMTPKRQKQLPSLTLVIIIDISGSMTVEEDGIPKVRLAAEAASAAVGVLQPIDYVNVFGFDTMGHEVVPMTQARDKNAIHDQIYRLEAGGGGIMAYSSLQLAYGVIKNASTQVKHIILCADAQDTEEQEGCLALAEQMKQEKITLSVIGFGGTDDPHVAFHKQLASAGGGQAYLAERVSNLPQIFTRDVLTTQKSLFVEEPFTPRFNAVAQPDLRNIDWGQTPPLLGYVQTAMKTTPSARQILASHKKDPICAAWTYGLGRSIAFTSDATQHWGAHWLPWSSYATFWSQMIRWTLRQANTANFRTMVTEEHGQGTIVVESVTAEGEYRNLLDMRAHVSHLATGELSGPQVTGDVLPLTQTAPGRYEARFPVRDTGAYQVTVEEREGDQVTGLQSTTLVIPYSPEYQSLQPNLSLLRQLVERTHGVLQPDAKAIFEHLRFSTRILRDLWHGVVALLCIFFLIDVATRRIQLPWQESLELLQRAIRRLLPARLLPAPATVAREPSALGTLLQTKEKTREQQENIVPVAAQLRETRQAQREKVKPAPAVTTPSTAPEPVKSTPSAMTNTLLQKKRERAEKPPES